MSKNIDNYLCVKKTEMLTIRITKAKKNFLLHLAEGKGTSVSDVVNACIDMAFSEED